VKFLEIVLLEAVSWDDTVLITVNDNSTVTITSGGDNNNNNNNYNLTFILRLKHAMQTQRRRSLQIGKTHDHHLEACCRGISSCYSEGTILNSHRVIDIATNTSIWC